MIYFSRLAAFALLFTTLQTFSARAVSADSKATTDMSKQPVPTAAHVDLPRFMGDWRVIANIPYFAEKNNVDSVESYALKPDGTIANWFTFRKKSFDAKQQKITAKAWIHNRETNAEWRVRFFGIITVKYLVLAVDPDYQWTIVGHPSRKYGWIMARQKTLPDATYQALLQKLPSFGYDPAKFVKVPQVR